MVTEVTPTDVSPSDPAYGWRYFDDGTAIDTINNRYYYQGQQVWQGDTDPINRLIKQYIYNPDTDDVNWAGIATGAAGLYSLFGGGSDVKSAGWSEPPPKLTATRQQVPVDNTNRRPGEAGRRYFTDVEYTPQDEASVQAAQQRAQQQAQGIAAAQPAYQPKVNPYAGTFKTPWENAPSAAPAPAPAQAAYPAVPTPEQLNEQGGLPASGYQMAQGGQVPQFKGNLQSGGFVVPGDVVRHADPMGQANKERGLAALHQTLGAQAIRGPGDAMSDSIPTTIDGKQPAAVANGEAYVPPQQVKRAGGADKLYNMMERLRMERTGSKKQINPDNPQQLAQAYQNGGGVRQFAEGGATSGTPTVPMPDLGKSTMNTLSPYIGEYVTSALGQGAAMAASPYQAYQGPLTAGPSDLQQQAFAGIQSIAGAGYTPETYSYQTGQFGGQTATQYMNPYLQAALDPQMQEMRRQADIARLSDVSRLTKAGAYGGSRQAIMESEGRRNLLDAQSKALGEGYMTAYDKALQQYNLEQGKRLEAQGLGEKSRQYSADYGLKSLADLASLGQTQRDIEQAGIEADKAQFEEERQYAYAQPAYQLGLLSGIPIGGQTTTPNTTGLGAIQGQIAGLGSIYKSIEGLFK
jgi:hypothetical protein